ncbi:MAG: hypothetical protein RR338_06220, partial [Clostridia bacterium]
MLENKLDKKWYGWIWCGIIFASLVRSLYPMITIFSDMAGAKAATITLNVIMELFFTGAVPAWLCYCCASIMFSMAWRRGYVFSSRTDFVYITMLFTAAARLVMGFIEIFSLFNAAIFIYSQIIL